MTETTTQKSTTVVRDKIAVLEFHRRMILQAIQGPLDPAHLVFALPPFRSHILWLTGHVATSTARLVSIAFNTPMPLPGSYMNLFGKGTEPLADAAAYPPLEELAAAIGRIFDAAVAGLEKINDADLSRPTPPELPVARLFPTLGELVSGIAFHTSYHMGQISLLRRAQGLPTGYGR